MSLIEERFHEHQRVVAATIEHLIAPLAEAAASLEAALAGDGKILFCGNGGSAADAQHLAAEFEGRFLHDRRPLPAMALTTNSSSITAIGNDFGYDHTFCRGVRAHGRPGDVLVGISTSGNSANVLQAAAAAKEQGMVVIALTGEMGGRLAEVADVLLDVPSKETPRIQEIHILIGHILCEWIEQGYVDSTSARTTAEETL